MQSLASFSASRVGRAYFIETNGFRRDGTNLVFQFDTGASMSIIGLNSICDGSDEKECLKDILENHISAFDKTSFDNATAKTVTLEEVVAYPCVISDISMMGVRIKKLFFHVVLGDINLPLLGFDFSDDCAYHHSINGDIDILAMTDMPGSKWYKREVIDFDRVLDEYYKQKL